MPSIAIPAQAAISKGSQIVHLLVAMLAEASARSQVRRGQRHMADAAVVMGA